MRKLVIRLSSIVVGIIVMLIGVYNLKANWVAKPLLQISYVIFGLKDNVVEVKNRPIHYLEGGKGETIVFIHGIFSRKENWMEMASSLTDEFHILALDLPGFGDNMALSVDQYSIENQTKNLLEVLEELNVKKAHFAANSMGAQLAASVAQKRPELVSSLALIGSPLGVPSPVRSEMESAMLRLESPLVVTTKEDFYNRSKWVSPNKILIPSPILELWATNEVSNAENNQKIWDVVHDKSGLQNLLEVAPELEAQSLIVWCDQDRVFHVSGAELLSNAFRSSKLVTLTNCGHLPMIDKPEEIALIYLEFLKSVDD